MGCDIGCFEQMVTQGQGAGEDVMLYGVTMKQRCNDSWCMDYG